MNEDKGLRYNQGKIRMDLLEPYAIEQLAKVFTKGAEKYADNNWLQGMKWSKMVASLKRHLLAFEKGKDFDFDPNCPDCQTGTCKNHTGLLHMAQVAWNAMGLVSYYKYHPEMDDRLHTIMTMPKIGTDLDDCIISWVKPWCEKFGHETPTDWYFSYNTHENFKTLEGDKLNDFYSTLPAKINPLDIPFPIACYITARTIDEDITKTWIEKNGFPTRPVYTVGFGQSKVAAAKEAGIDWFIDDNYETYLEMNKAGITCFLMDAPHNSKFNVGYKRIESFQDLKNRFL